MLSGRLVQFEQSVLGSSFDFAALTEDINPILFGSVET